MMKTRLEDIPYILRRNASVLGKKDSINLNKTIISIRVSVINEVPETRNKIDNTG